MNSMFRQTGAYLLHRTGGFAVLLWHALYVQGTSALRTYKNSAEPSLLIRPNSPFLCTLVRHIIYGMFQTKPQKGIGSSSAPRPAFSNCAVTPACKICHCIIPQLSLTSHGHVPHICIMPPPEISKSLLLIWIKTPYSAVAAQPQLFCQPTNTLRRGAKQCLMHLSTARGPVT